MFHALITLAMAASAVAPATNGWQQVLDEVAPSVVVMRVMANRLFGIAAYDPLTLSGTVLVVLGIAALATWLPARRATRVDPSVVLRSE